MTPKNFPRNRERKKVEAKERQARADRTSPEERLGVLDAHGFRALKERAKLAARMKAEAPRAAEGPPATEPQPRKRRQAREEKRAA